MMDLAEINKCFFNGAYIESFEALRILYADLLKKPREMIEKDWREFLKRKENVKINASNFARNSIKLEEAISRFLYKEIPEIKAKFVAILEECDLLNLDTKVKPRFESSNTAIFEREQ